ncbi:MAG: purine-nucleoside phosphorylase [Erysipelotrichaceae bacterium]|nr:purine-nucleoside phosphorylase [Erysipelotrichaceae bacterium]
MNEVFERCKQAADYIGQHLDAKDAIGIVLGSGLGELGDEIENPVYVDYSDIPNFPKTTVPGHKGRLICGYLNGTKVLCMQGRFHFYEGHDMKTVAMPTRVMKLLGVKALILTNAAGGCNKTFKPGTLMFIEDFINYMGDNPLYGENIDELGPRFPDMTKAIDPEYNALGKKVAEELGIEVRSGVYMAFRGPNFETPAEIRFAQTIGADAVGMSTVPEILAARHCGLKVIGISCITNMAAGMTGEELTHEEVQETADKVKDQFKQLIKEIVRQM